MEAILAACSRVEASSIKKYFNRAPTSAGAGPSGVTPATGNDDAKATKKAKKTPDTPDGRPIDCDRVTAPYCSSRTSDQTNEWE
jgi:hypothetical protein